MASLTNDGLGFGIVSFNLASDQVELRAFSARANTNKYNFYGLSEKNVAGIVLARLDKRWEPLVLEFGIERTDVGLPPQPKLTTTILGPTTGSPGQEISYVVQVRNEGLKKAENMSVIVVPPTLANLVSVSSNCVYNGDFDMLRWDIPEIDAKSTLTFSFSSKLFWGLPRGLEVTTKAYHFTKSVADWILESGSSVINSYETIDPIKKEIYYNWLGVIGSAPLSGYLILPGVVTFASAGVTAASLASSGGSIINGILLAMLGKARLEYQLSLILDKENTEYYHEIYSMYYSMLYSPQTIKDEGVNLSNGKHFNSDELYSVILDEMKRILNFSAELIAGAETIFRVLIAVDPNQKYGPQGDLLPGQRVQYRIEFENEGQGIAFGVYFTDVLNTAFDDNTLQIGAVYDIADGLKIAEPGVYNSLTRTITWLVGELGPSKGGFADISVKLLDSVVDDTPVINSATVFFPSVPEVTQTNPVVNIVRSNRRPNASISQSYEGVEGALMTLDASASNDPDNDLLKYRWDFNDDGIWDTDYSSSPQINHSWLDDFEGFIAVEVSDGIHSAKAQTGIKIKNVQPNVEAGADQFVNPDVSVKFEGGYFDPGLIDTHAIKWDFGNGETATDSLKAESIYHNLGIYLVRLTVTDNNGGVGEDVLTVNVVAPCVPLDQCHETGTYDAEKGSCTNPVKENGALCDADSNGCTVDDACNNGNCLPGNAPDCSYQNDQCNAGKCSSNGSTSYICIKDATSKDGVICNDANACTQTDKCALGTCIGGNPVVCTALDQCHDPGVCYTDTGKCSTPNKLNGADCSAGNVCTHDDYCNEGECITGSNIDCDDGNECTNDSCDASSGCNHTAAADWTLCAIQNELAACFNGNCEPTPTNDKCSGAIELTLEQELSASMNGYHAFRAIDTPCASEKTAGTDAFYKLNVETGRIYTLTVTPDASVDIALTLWSDCADSSECLVYRNYAAIGEPEVLPNITSPASGTVIIQVVALASTGSYKILANDVTPVDGDLDEASEQDGLETSDEISELPQEGDLIAEDESEISDFTEIVEGDDDATEELAEEVALEDDRQQDMAEELVVEEDIQDETFEEASTEGDSDFIDIHLEEDSTDNVIAENESDQDVEKKAGSSGGCAGESLNIAFVLLFLMSVILKSRHRGLKKNL